MLLSSGNFAVYRMESQIHEILAENENADWQVACDPRPILGLKPNSSIRSIGKRLTVELSDRLAQIKQKIKAARFRPRL
jgi:hypothetical protein